MNAGASGELGVEPGNVCQQRKQAFCIAVIIKPGWQENASAVVIQFAVFQPAVDVEAAGAGEPSTGTDDFTHGGQIAAHL